jgi:hypothetical protein
VGVVWWISFTALSDMVNLPMSGMRSNGMGRPFRRPARRNMLYIRS